MKKLRNNSVVLMGVIIIAKLTGMARDIVLANYFGTTNISDAFLVAITIPTMLFYFIGHALSTAYIPMYNKVRQEKGERQALLFSNNLLTLAMGLSGVIALFLLLFPGAIVKVFAVGFDKETAALASRMIRISCLSIFFMTAVNICGGYLQANKNYLAPAAISLPRNFAIVVFIVLASALGTDWLGFGLLIAYVLEFLFLLPFVLFKGYRFQLVLDLKDEYIKQSIYIIAPIFLGVFAGRVNKIVDRSMASTIVEGGISALTYASVINNAIQEILVTGLITILFASCAELAAKNQIDQVKKKLSSTLGIMTTLLIPGSIGILILAEPIVELILCRGQFDAHSLEMTVGALRCYTLGLCFLAVRDTLIKVFYAYKDTKTTTVVSTSAIVLNIVLNIVLGRMWGLHGLALATSTCAVVSSSVLYILLRKKIGDFGSARNLRILLKSMAGSLVMGIVAYYGFGYLSANISGIAALLATVLVSCGVYGLLELLLRNEAVTEVLMQYRPKPSDDKRGGNR